MENLKDDEKELTRKVSYLRMKLFWRQGWKSMKNPGRWLNLEKDGRAKVDRIKELEHKVTRLEAMNDSARYQITQVKHRVEIQKARTMQNHFPRLTAWMDGSWQLWSAWLPREAHSFSQRMWMNSCCSCS